MKRKLAFILTVLALIFYAFIQEGSALGFKDSDGITVSEERVKEEKPYIRINLVIPKFTIPFNKALENTINSQLYKDITDFKKSTEAIALENNKDLLEKGISITPYEAITKYTIHHTKDILSVVVNYYQYTGGAHGIYTLKPYNYDLKSGKRLALGDLFKAGYDYKTIINNEIKSAIAKEPEQYFVNEFNSIRDDQEFYITDRGIIVYFQVYEIAPFAAGNPEFLIPFSLIKEGLKLPISPN